MNIMYYSVYDSKAGAYSAPFACHNDEVAKRAMVDCFSDSSHPICTNPEDFSLHFVGEFDVNVGCFLESDAIRIMEGVEAMKLHRTRVAYHLGDAATDNVVPLVKE